LRYTVTTQQISSSEGFIEDKTVQVTEEEIDLRYSKVQKGELLPLKVNKKTRWFKVFSVTPNGVYLEGDISDIEEGNFGFSWKGYWWTVEEVDTVGMRILPFLRTKEVIPLAPRKARTRIRKAIKRSKRLGKRVG
jgi:hypothetical protein